MLREDYDAAAPGGRQSLTISVDSVALSDSDADRVRQAAVRFGYVQGSSVYCLNERPHELVLLRYTPDAARLSVILDGARVSDIRE